MKTKRPNQRPGFISSDPAWEAMKAARRSISHDDAAQVVSLLQNQYRLQWSNRVAESPVELYSIVRTLTQKRIPFVVTGAHGIAGWTGKPRNTEDVDILVKAGRNKSRAIKAIQCLYPQLEVRDFFGVTGFFLPGERSSVIDVTHPHRADIAETLANPTWTENEKEGVRYRVPSLEEALANKYGAMLSPSREMDKRTVDAADFMRMVKHSGDEGQKPIDLQRLEILGEKVWLNGGGQEILCLVEQVKAGKAIHIDSMGQSASQRPETQS